MLEIQAFVQLIVGMEKFQDEKPVMILIRQTLMVAQVLVKLSKITIALDSLPYAHIRAFVETGSLNLLQFTKLVMILTRLMAMGVLQPANLR